MLCSYFFECSSDCLDALDNPHRSPYDFDHEDVRRASPGSSKRYSSPGGVRRILLRFNHVY